VDINGEFGAVIFNPRLKLITLNTKKLRDENIKINIAIIIPCVDTLAVSVVVVVLIISIIIITVTFPY